MANPSGEIIPAYAADGQAVKIGAETFYVTPYNYRTVADKYWDYQRRQFGSTIDENMRAAYYDTFATLAKAEATNYTLDENGAAVPNDQGYGFYLFETVKGGLSGTADEFAKLPEKLPQITDVRFILIAATVVALLSLVRR